MKAQDYTATQTKSIPILGESATLKWVAARKAFKGLSNDELQKYAKSKNMSIRQSVPEGYWVEWRCLLCLEEAI